MDPLSAYLLTALKNERTCNTRQYDKYEMALGEMGYWVIFRPAWIKKENMGPCKIREECRLIEEFPMTYGGDDYTVPFDVIVELYSDDYITGYPQWA